MPTNLELADKIRKKLTNKTWCYDEGDQMVDFITLEDAKEALAAFEELLRADPLARLEPAMPHDDLNRRIAKAKVLTQLEQDNWGGCAPDYTGDPAANVELERELCEIESLRMEWSVSSRQWWVFSPARRGEVIGNPSRFVAVCMAWLAVFEKEPHHAP